MGPVAATIFSWLETVVQVQGHIDQRLTMLRDIDPRIVLNTLLIVGTVLLGIQITIRQFGKYIAVTVFCCKMCLHFIPLVGTLFLKSYTLNP